MKAIAKAILRSLALIAVAPALLCYVLHAAVGGRDRAFPGWSQLMSLVPGSTGVYLRHAFYRCTLSRCEPDVCVSFGTVVSHPGASFGETAYVGSFCMIGNVTIERDVLIASHVSVMNGCRQHSIERLDVPIREQIGEYQDITIGEDSWIGERATIAANVGKHCVIGAGSLVLHDIPDYSIAVGVPAKVVRDRRQSNTDE